jgi:hypothetical protein
LTCKSKLMEVRPHGESSPERAVRAELDEALVGVGQEQDPVETIGRLGARLILQQALEDEVTEFSAGPATNAPRRRSRTATATSGAR